ncbi:MAG: hypothetical protein GX490_09200 [Bacilli bacterium]|nr:hypothetical protein [Bacilli bacterium]
MKYAEMKALITDINVLLFIHDIMYLQEKEETFSSSNTYKELHEPNIITIIKYLKNVILVTLGFICILILIKHVTFSSSYIKYTTVLILSIIFGILFVRSKTDFVLLGYQLKAKKAVQFALANYNYQEFVIFLDCYLSEESTKNYSPTY